MTCIPGSTPKVGGDGGFDYIYADSDGRRLYVARGGSNARVSAYNLDTLEPAGEIPMTNARGAAVDAKSHHGFASSKPVPGERFVRRPMVPNSFTILAVGK